MPKLARWEKDLFYLGSYRIDGSLLFSFMGKIMKGKQKNMANEKLKEALIRQLKDHERMNSHGPHFRALRARLKECFGIDWEEYKNKKD